MIVINRRPRRGLLKFGAVAAIVAVLTLGLVAPASASTTNVSGTITDPSSAAVSGATVSFDDQTTPGTPVTATTNGSGQYTAAVTATHSYNISVSASGLATTTYYGYTINGSTLSLSVQLRSTTHTVSGTVQDKNGVTLPSETVKIRDSKGTLAQTTSDASGNYSLTAPSYNDYSIETTGGKTNSSALVPGWFIVNTPLDLTSDTTKTVAIEAVTVTIHVRDTNGAIPIGTSTASLTSHNTTAMISQPYAAYVGLAGPVDSNNTDSNADRTMVLLANSKYSISAIGSYIDGYGQNTAINQTLGTSDTAITINISVNRHTISGRVTGLLSSNGVSYKGKDLTVRLMNLNGSYRTFTTTTDSNGDYSLNVPSNAGSGTSYRLYVESSNTGNNTMNPLSGSFSAYSTVDMSADRTGDVVFPYDLAIYYAYDNLGQSINQPLKVVWTAESSINLSAPFTGSGVMTVTGFGNNLTYSGYPYYVTLMHGATYTAAAGAMTGSVYGTDTDTGLASNSTSNVFTVPNNMGTPSYPSASSPTNSAPYISWNYAGSGAYGASYYQVYRNDVYLGTTTNKNYTDSSLTTGGTYTYKMTAVNSQGTIGPKSTGVAVVYNP